MNQPRALHRCYRDRSLEVVASDIQQFIPLRLGETNAFGQRRGQIAIVRCGPGSGMIAKESVCATIALVIPDAIGNAPASNSSTAALPGSRFQLAANLGTASASNRNAQQSEPAAIAMAAGRCPGRALAPWTEKDGVRLDLPSVHHRI